MNIEESFSKLSSRGALALGLIIAFLYFLAVYDDGTNAETQIAQVKEQILNTKKNIKIQKKAISEYNNHVARKKKLGEKFNKLSSYIPETFTTNQQMKILSEQAKTSGASIVEIKKSGKGASFKFFEEVLVEVKLSGTFSQVVLFLSFLTKIDKVIVLKRLKLEKLENTNSEVEGDEAPSVTFIGEFAGFRMTKEEEKKN